MNCHFDYSFRQCCLLITRSSLTLLFLMNVNGLSTIQHMPLQRSQKLNLQQFKPFNPMIFGSALNQSRITTLRSTKINESGSPATLKPAAIPLLDAGKALARTGELLIDVTTELDIYGGALSATGACIRNAGDNIAQAAASCRFKTGKELVIDEIREAATMLSEGTAKLRLAVTEAKTDKNDALSTKIEPMINHMNKCSNTLEKAGAVLMQQQPPSTFGKYLISAGQDLNEFADLILKLPGNDGTMTAQSRANEAANRCKYSSVQMILAGTNLCPSEATQNTPSSSKSWLKGGQ